MIKRLTALAAVCGLLLAAMLAAGPVLGGNAGEVELQTWPSRTPTPSGPPQPPNPPGTGQPPEATLVATAQPGVTPEPTLPSSGVSGSGQPIQPQGGTFGEGLTLETLQLPSAAEVGDCGLPPLAVASAQVNVRSGPGIEYDIIAELSFQEERPIIGRAADAPWWQILVSIGWPGWVSDQAVTVVGYTGVVPIVGLDNRADVQEPAWNPTPNPTCTPPSLEEITFRDGQLATAVVAVDSSVSENVPTPDTTATSEDNTSDSAGLSPLRPDDSAGGLGLVWLPIIGGLLIVAGGIAFLVQRRRA